MNVRAAAILLAACGAAGTTLAQQSSSLDRDPFDQSSLPALEERGGPPRAPQLTFQLVAEIALPGPLPGGSPQQVGQRVEIPVAGGVALTEPADGATPEVRAAPDAASAAPVSSWALDARGRTRFGPSPGGFMIAERRCRHCKNGWRKVWKLKAPVSALAAPLLLADRLCFGALDNRVSCVGRKNGHRRWASDVGARASRPLVAWKGTLPAGAGDGAEPRTLDVIVVVPDEGQEMLALDARDGRKLGAVKLTDEEGRWSGVPLATADGAIVVGRTKYNVEEASLLVYRLVPALAGTATASAAVSSSSGPPAESAPR